MTLTSCIEKYVNRFVNASLKIEQVNGAKKYE
jgi:hypothetical protein